MLKTKNDIRVRGYILKRKTKKNGKPHEYYYVQLVFKDCDGNEKKESHSIGIVTKKSEAKAEMERLVEEKREELRILKSAENDGERIIFLDSFKSWLKSKKSQVEINTLDGYYTRAKSIIQYFEKLTEARDVDAIYLDEMRPVDIYDFYNYELEYGKVNRKTGKLSGLSRDTVLSYSGLLFNYFRDMAKLEIIPVNICKEVDVPRVQVNNTEKNKKHYMTLDQLKEFMDVTNSFGDKRLIPIVKLCVSYGLRRSEVLGLKWDAVDFDNNTVEIKSTAVRGIKGVYYKDNTKSESSHRMYPMTAPIKNCLLKLENLQKEKGCYKPTGLVFWNIDKNKPYSPDYMSKLFKKIIKQCESIPDDFHFHDLRKTCTTLFHETEEWTLEELVLWIGHRDGEDKSYKTLLANYLTISLPWKRKKVPLIEKLFEGIF